VSVKTINGGSGTVADGSITSAKIADGTIVNSDFSASATFGQYATYLNSGYTPVKGANYPHWDATGTAATLVDGQIVFHAIPFQVATTVNGLAFIQTQTGNYTADNNNRVGLYSTNGTTLTLVASSANDGSLWQTASANTGFQVPFTTPYSLTVPGLYYAAFIYNNSAQTTAPQIIQRAAGASGTNAPFGNDAFIQATLSSQTDLPSPTQLISGLTIGTTPQLRWVGWY
jgi:hypothetical protein